MKIIRKFFSGNLAVLVICAVMIVVLPVSLTTPFSKLYKMYNGQKKLLERAVRLNTERLHHAEGYFQSENLPTSQRFYQTGSHIDLDMVICIVTLSRKNNQSSANPGYLLQTAAWMDKLVRKANSFGKKFLFLCNVDELPENHRDAVFLRQYLHFTEKFGKSSFHIEIAHSKRRNKQYTGRQKESEDYSYCLEVSYSINATYILMLEDDALPHRDLFSILNYTMEHRILRKSHRYDGTEPVSEFSFLKLYYPEKWLGFAFETLRIIELISFAFVGGVVSFCLFTFLQKRALVHRYKYKTQIKVVTFGFLLTAVSLLIVGRQTVLEFRRISPQLYTLRPEMGCCTPAILYNSDIIPELSQYILTHLDVHKDIAISDFVKEQQVAGHYLEPNLFYHLGMYTSHSNTLEDPERYQYKINLV